MPWSPIASPFRPPKLLPAVELRFNQNVLVGAIYLYYGRLYLYTIRLNLDRPSLGGVLGPTINRQDRSYYRCVKGDRARNRADNGKRRRFATSGRALYRRTGKAREGNRR